MPYFYTIASGKDIGIVGGHFVIYHDAARIAHGEAAIRSQLAVRPYSHSNYGTVSLEGHV